MNYTFTPTSSGSIQVADSTGKILSTGTADNATLNYGYVPPTANAPKPVTSEAGVVSSAQGVDAINQKTATLSNLTPKSTTGATPYSQTNTDPNASKGTVVDNSYNKTPTQTKVTLINPSTGQSQTFENAEVNQSAIQALMNSGYQTSETSSNGTVPNWLTASSTGTTDTPNSKAQAEVDSASSDLKSLTDSLSKYTVSDADLLAQTNAISAQWDARIADMQKINDARKNAINTSEIRLGSQYAGGSGGQTGSIISEEERQGVVRIGELESQKQSAIAAAKSAAASQNWQVYSKQVDLAQKSYDDKISALKDLQTATAAKNKIIADQLQHDQDAAAKTQSDLTKSINDVLTAATKNGLTDPKTIQAIQNAPDAGTAMSLAGGFLHSEADVLDAQYKKAQIAKIYNDMKLDNSKAILDASGNAIDPSQAIAYANQYASTGQIPTGLPKGSFGQVAAIAKELPKSPGQIIDVNTGVSPAGNNTLTSAMSSLYSAVELAGQLKELDQKRWGGVVAGTLGKVFGSQDQQKYVDLRAQIVDLLSRARSGAALTPHEEELYGGMLPGRFSEPLGLGADSELKIDNFVSALTSDLKNKASSNGWAINGLSDVKVGDTSYKVGDVIQNASGQKGRVNADGSITLIQ